MQREQVLRYRWHKLLFDDTPEVHANGGHGKILGGEIALAIEMGADAVDIGVNAQAVTQAQATLRKRILRAFVGRGLLQGFEAKEMLGYKHSGFSVDTSVCIAAQDRAGLERLRKAGSELVYRCAKQHSEPVQPPQPQNL